jgi:hypothetical protein
MSSRNVANSLAFMMTTDGSQVWKIYGTTELNERFSRYRIGVERSRHVTEGNTRRRFHGTLRECCLGDDDNCRDLCNSNSCSLCCIIAVRATRSTSHSTLTILIRAHSKSLRQEVTTTTADLDEVSLSICETHTEVAHLRSEASTRQPHLPRYIRGLSASVQSAELYPGRRLRS